MTDDTRTRIDAAILAWEDQNDIHDPEAAATAGCAAADLLREVRDLIPEPIPYPDDEAHQMRWTMQRAFDNAMWETGDRNEGMIAAGDALFAAGFGKLPERRAVTDEMVEAAARTMFEGLEPPPPDPYTWTEMVHEDPSRADLWRSDARTVLEAAEEARRAYADRDEERAGDDREALERLLGAHRPDRDSDPPTFDGRVLSHRQACAVADAVLASDVWRNRCKHAWRRVSPGFDTTKEAYESLGEILARLESALNIKENQ